MSSDKFDPVATALKMVSQKSLQSLTVHWIRIVNGIDKICQRSHADPRGRECFGEPAAKARPISKPSLISDVNSIPIGHRRWIDIETQKSNDPYCFQVSKFITRLQDNVLLPEGFTEYVYHIGNGKELRSAILSNRIKRNYSPHTACRVHGECDMHEDQGSASSEGKRDSKTACCS